MNKVTVSTHVLHLGTGRPVAGVRVQLEPDGGFGVTDEDGRLRFPEELDPGVYELRFELEAVNRLYRAVALTVHLEEARHYHLPVLVSPYGVTSYRGS